MTTINNIIVVKVGTSSMFRRKNGHELLDHQSMKRIGDQIIELRKSGYHIVLVSSGAVTAGMEATGLAKRPSGKESMPEKQRLATIGWKHVLNAWFKATGVENGGLLVTRRELNLDTPEHDEVLKTTYTLLSHGEIPILNENDGITHGELTNQSFGQNDELAAIYASQIAKSKYFTNIRLILLSDVDGVYRDVNNPDSIIRTIDLNNFSSLKRSAQESNSIHGTGGMKTKFYAARIAGEAGIEMWIANSHTNNSIQLALDGKIGTHFRLQKKTPSL